MVHLDYKYVFSAAGEGQIVGQYLEVCRPLNDRRDEEMAGI
jgi:hypothetical protein